jgi:EAL domain-containing protein (putative c-di-GMP-specific phosphodiesterase class I)
LTAAAIDRFELIRSALPSADVTALVGKAAERIEALVNSAVYRIAPDPLAWLVPAGSDPETACAKVAGSFDRPVDTGTNAVDVAWTFGLATRAPETGSGALIERAQAALNDARTGGRSHQWFRGIGAEALRNLSIMGELRRGIDENQLFVAYQPKLHLKSGAIAQAEALVRWRHPVEGLIAPDRFIPLAEETGVVREITRFVLARAIADCREANRTDRSIAVSVNVSAADVEEPGFVDELVNMLATANLRPHQLTLEITESAFISSKEMARDVLDALRREQVRLSIDDYGTGQSTLSYLKTFPVDELKIDKLFVTQLCATESDRIMVASTVDLAHQLGLSVVAEGAEDWDTIRVLTELGCDYAQGYAVGRAMPFADLLRLSTAQLSKAA